MLDPSDGVTCTDVVTTTNLFVNPSFEDGLTGWTNSYGMTVVTSPVTDGSHALYAHPSFPEKGRFRPN